MSVKYVLKNTLEEVLPFIRPDTLLAFDLETEGLYGRIRLAQFFQEGWQAALLVSNPTKGSWFTFLAAIQRLNATLLTHYGTYDISTLQTQMQADWVPKSFEDTFYLGRLACPLLPNNKLDSLLGWALGRDPYKEAGLVKAELQSCSWDVEELSEAQLTYAAIDVFYLPYLFSRLQSWTKSKVYKLDIATCVAALEFQTAGMSLSLERIQELEVSFIKEREEIDLSINSKSWKQVREFCQIKESDDHALAYHSIVLNNFKAGKVRRDRKIRTLDSYLQKFKASYPIVKGRFAPATKSGRLKCEKANIQQVARELKTIFEASEDKVLVYADYPQLELRTIAAITRDELLIKLFKENIDPHGYVAKAFFGEDYTKEQRNITKQINFNSLYGGSAKMIQKIILRQASIWVPLQEIELLLRRWKRLFKEVARWQERGKRAWRNEELGVTPGGRRYIANLYTDQLNIENQGYGADIAKTALCKIQTDLQTIPSAKLVNSIHDSYIVECEASERVYKKVCQVVGQAMLGAWKELSALVKGDLLPMHADVSVGKNWGDLEKGANVLYSQKFELV